MASSLCQVPIACNDKVLCRIPHTSVGFSSRTQCFRSFSRNASRFGNVKLRMNNQKIDKLNVAHKIIAIIASSAVQTGEYVQPDNSQSTSQSPPGRFQFPWAAFSSKLKQSFSEVVWAIEEWVFIPAFVLTTLLEVIFTVSKGKELLIPIGLLVGTLVSGVLKETFVTLGADFQDNELPLHLFSMGLLFLVLKVVALKWSHALLIQIANGGLWQSIRFSLDWKKKKEFSPQM